MTLFLSVFLILYGGLHLYAFVKAQSALGFGLHAGICLCLFMAAMTVAPLIVHLLEKAGYDLLARLVSFVSYSWMAVLFLFFSISLVIDFYHLMVSVGSLFLKTDLSHLKISSHYAFVIPLLLALSIAIYGYFEARHIRTEKLTIETSKIPKEVGTVKIVQISDVHLGLVVRQDRLERILKQVRAADPDILISTGDLVDGQINSLTGLAESLSEINPRYGKFAITGNHEFYAGLDQALAFTRKAGFKVLRDEGLTVAGLINIAGVDDPAERYFGISRGTTEKEVLSGLPRERFTLFLKHRPLLDKGALGLFDLQISGHVHKGQIFPFSIATWLYYPTDSGIQKLPGNAHLYVSKGSGTWGPPIRFLSPPEVTLIELVPESG